MEFIYMNEDQIDSLLKCTICKYPFTDPVFIPALDIRLCRLCIPQASTFFNAKLDEFSSLDGNIVRMDDQLLRQLLDELPIQCIACRKERIYRKDFPTHRLKECPKRLVLCKASDLKCSWSGPYEEYDAHLQNCTFELLRPILIDNLTYRKQIEKYDEIFRKQEEKIEQLQNQLEKHDELFTDQQNQIEQLQNQQKELQQFRTQLEQYGRRLDTLQNSFRLVLQEKQAQKAAHSKENQESVSIQKTVNDDILQLKDQLEQLAQTFSSMNNTEAVDQLKQQLNQFEIDLKQSQDQYTSTTTQLKQIQDKNTNVIDQVDKIKKQETEQNKELAYLRQSLNKQETQIRLLARKKCVIPRSYSTIDTRIDDLIESYPEKADINLAKKHFDNQDLEAICKRAMFDKKCRKLHLEHNDINGKGATIIADHLYGNGTLNDLCLSDNNISDIGVHAFAQVLSINNHCLTWLELHSNNITDEGVEYLSQMLETNQTLILLGLNANKITDRGVQLLAGAVTYYNKSLQWLLLAANKGITDASIESFSDMFMNNTTLQVLWVKDCGFSKDGIQRMQEAATSIRTNFSLEI